MYSVTDYWVLSLTQIWGSAQLLIDVISQCLYLHSQEELPEKWESQSFSIGLHADENLRVRTVFLELHYKNEAAGDLF